MSANADVLQRSGLIGSPAQEAALPRAGDSGEAGGWNPEDFAREQIRGLVRRVFFAGGERPVKQVVFSATEPNIDVASICDQVAQALALETRAAVAIAERERGMAGTSGSRSHSAGSSAIKSWSTQIGINLWRVSVDGECGEGAGTGLHWLSHLAALRKEFEYAVIHGPAAGTSSEAALLGQLADGIILVLGAHSTRKATARQIKESLEGAQCRILGTVLSKRTFPVPERIYRRL
ncbi:MAG: hypothetical protein WCC89_13435 [Candidatus Sulfotelmatobacter sp.]|jgi:hypothetical protein